MQRKLFSSGNTPRAALSSRTAAGGTAARGDAATRGPPWIGVEMAGASLRTPARGASTVRRLRRAGCPAVRCLVDWIRCVFATGAIPALAHGTAIAVRVRTVQAACGASRHMLAPSHCASCRHRVASVAPHDAEPTRHGGGWTLPTESEAGTCVPASPAVVPGRSSGLNVTGSKRPRRIALPTQFSALRAAARGRTAAPPISPDPACERREPAGSVLFPPRERHAVCRRRIVRRMRCQAIPADVVVGHLVARGQRHVGVTHRDGVDVRGPRPL